MRNLLNNPSTNIDIAARLMKIYLNEMCEAAKTGAMSLAFTRSLAFGCDIEDFSCLNGNDCDDIVNNEIPRCLASGMAAVWNNGLSGALNAPPDYTIKMPNMAIHSTNMEEIYDKYRDLMP